VNDFLDTSRKDLAIGMDIGGTNIRAALFRGLASAAGGEPPEPLASLRREVGEPRDPDTVVGKIASTVSTLRAEAGIDGATRVPVGVGFAGMLRGKEGYVANSPNLRWREVPLGKMLRESLGVHVGVFNDVNAITYGEYAFGAGRGVGDILAVFVGTGIGSGAIVDGRLVEGFNGTALELGHTKVVIDESARPCACGLRGCVEAYVGGDLLTKRARLELSQGIRSAAVRMAGNADQVTLSHLDAAAAEGDAYALELFAEVAPLLGLVLANAVTTLNPQRLILGGGVLSRTPVLREHVVAGFEVAVNPPARHGLEVVDSTLGDAAGRLGAALLALHTAV
jgi:glucokinase